MRNGWISAKGIKKYVRDRRYWFMPYAAIRDFGLFFEVENDFSGEIIFDSETGLPISSKEDRKLHGLGMENMQRCAKKYMGDMDITIHDMGDRKKFNLTIMMYEKYFTP